ncbi:MAG: S9 family peptidase [Chloroflexi bacterium]|nr:S9 family peptidase [Chloroflexota bacterium]
MNLETLLRVPDVENNLGHDISPDGLRVAFAWNKTGDWQIYELTIPTPNLPIPNLPIPNLPITSGPGGKVFPRYSPDGKFLAYACDLDGSENFHIILRDLASGHERDLTPDIAFTIQPSFAWSPDSKQIAYLADQSGNFDLYILDVDSPLPAGVGLGVRVFFSSGGPAHYVRWSPDGRAIAVVTEMEWQSDGVFVVPLDGGEAKRVGGNAAPIDADQPAWSPDSSKLVFASNESGWTQIGIYNLMDESIEWITDDESDKAHPTWSDDGTRIAWVSNRGETAWVEVRSMDGTRQRVQTDAGFAYWPIFTRDSRAVVFVHENPRRPSDLWLAALDGGPLLPLTESLPADVDLSEFVTPQAVTYPSLDGTPIPAILYKPKNARADSPAVVVIHGGPAWHIAFYWNPIMSHMAARGWTVIAPNYRGSTGYGRDWLVSNRFEIGHLDNDDCAAAAQYLIREGLANPKKIAVTGRSHGGYLTMTCMTRQPELWAVGSAVVPFLNWFTGHENSREDLQYWDIQNMGDPETHHDLWHERSPFFFLDQVRAPVQFICGETDPRCPPSESTEAHQKLQSLGIPSELLLYEGEGHGFLKIENVLDSDVRRVEFLAKVLES